MPALPMCADDEDKLVTEAVKSVPSTAVWDKQYAMRYHVVDAQRNAGEYQW